jgi:hypothetical protein
MAYDAPLGSIINAVFEKHYLPRCGDDLYLGNAPYWPRRGDVLDFDFWGEYTPPDGDSIAFGEAPETGVVEAIFDLKAAISSSRSSSFDTKAGVTLLVELARSFDTRATISRQLSLPFDTLIPLEVHKLPPSPDFEVLWGQYPAIDNQRGSGWKDRRSVNASVGMGWIKRLAVDSKTASPWRHKGPLDQGRKAAWNAYAQKESTDISSRWYSRNVADGSCTFAWNPLRALQLSRGNRIFHPPAVDVRKGISFDAAIIIDITNFVLPWGNPPPNDHWHRTLWGAKFYKEICFRTYPPPKGDAIVLNLDMPIILVDDGINIRFRFDQLTYDRRCRHREPSGWRDAYFYRKPTDTSLYGERSRIYIMLNSAFLTRLPESTAIDANPITIGTDWDSMYWTIRAGIGRDAHLAMLESTPDGPIIVESEINGHFWNFQVDSWGTSDAFASKSRTISGRSVSAQLGAPMAEVRTRTETSARTALQLMNDELEYTDWTVVFDGLDDWLVPGNVLSYSDMTPMAVIKTIADAAGAMVQTDMAAQTIRIKKRHPAPPWLWSVTTPSVVIPDSMAIKIDGEWDERPFYNAVFLSGEAGGISARVYREGSAGDLVAPQITDKLITATEAARARGIAVLGMSGKWSKQRIELPVFTPPGVPGVLKPGTLIEFTIASPVSSWRGVVSAVSVTANFDRDKGLRVRQTIDVERYRGN